MRKIVLLLTLTFLFFVAESQIKDRCGSAEMIRQEMAANPAYAKKVEELLKNKGNSDRNNQKGKPDNPGNPPSQSSITIPVVVHVLWNTPAQNISDVQVQSQIDVLNEDFTAGNRDYNNYDAGYGSVKGDLDINFCLVQVIHKQTKTKSFAANDNMKYNKRGGSDAVDPMHVLNIWVCNLSSILGFAYYPGITPEKFGVVCHTNAFGKGTGYNLFAEYNLGRTTTHEVGHCFGLEHIWGGSTCGNDFVDDTPLHNTANFGCPGEGHLSTCTGTPLEMWMNYMDYTDDRCMYFFTDGQASRASFFIDTDPQLNSIVNSACTNQNRTPITTISANDLLLRKIDKSTISLYPSITTARISLEIGNPQIGKAEINIYNQAGAFMMKQQIFISGKIVSQVDVSKLKNGMYYLELNQGGKKQTQKFIVHH